MLALRPTRAAVSPSSHSSCPRPPASDTGVVDTSFPSTSNSIASVVNPNAFSSSSSLQSNVTQKYTPNVLPCRIGSRSEGMVMGDQARRYWRPEDGSGGGSGKEGEVFL